MHWPLYTVGQVADLLGVQPAFLRRLDTRELVRPTRSQGGQRRYSRLEISRIEQVVGLVEEGFTLAAIRRVLELQSEVAELQLQLAAEQARNTPRDGSLPARRPEMTRRAGGGQRTRP